MPVRIVYFGTSAFAIPPLLRLLDQPERFAVVAVVSQPDRPVGRKAVLTPTPISRAAQERGVKLLRYASLKPDEVAAELAALDADLFITAAYGKIVPQRILDISRAGAVNLHGSLLPAYRGASPIQAAILAGDKVSGVSLMRMDAEVDHGPVYATTEVPIVQAGELSARDTFTTLEAKLAEAAAGLLVRHAEAVAAGTLAPVEQDHAAATFTGLVAKEDGRADFTRETATELERRLRAYTPWPGLFMEWTGGESLKLLRVEAVDAASSTSAASPSPQTLAPGERSITEDGFPAIGTRESTLVLYEVQPAGKKPMDGRAFVNGYGWGKKG